MRVGILVRFLFLPPFLSFFAKTFSHLYSSVSSPMARTKTTANPPPLNVNYRDLYSWAPVELLDECSSLVSTKAWRDHAGEPCTYDHRAIGKRHDDDIAVFPCTLIRFCFLFYIKGSTGTCLRCISRLFRLYSVV